MAATGLSWRNTATAWPLLRAASALPQSVLKCLQLSSSACTWTVVSQNQSVSETSLPSMPPGSTREELSGGHASCFTLSHWNLPKPHTYSAIKQYPDPREEAVLEGSPWLENRGNRELWGAGILLGRQEVGMAAGQQEKFSKSWRSCWCTEKTKEIMWIRFPTPSQTGWWSA